MKPVKVDRPGKEVMMEQPIRVLLVDDHSPVRRGLRALFATARDILVIGEAVSFPDAIHEARLRGPDIVVLDWLAPQREGEDLIASLKHVAPTAHILVLTNRADADHIEAALSAGAEGYLLKDPGLQDVLQAIRRIQRGEQVLHPAVKRVLQQG